MKRVIKEVERCKTDIHARIFVEMDGELFGESFARIWQRELRTVQVSIQGQLEDDIRAYGGS